jgi:DNA-binding FadR family transcriptional regulator
MSEPGSLIRSIGGRLAARNYHTFVINEIGLGIVTGRFPVGSILPSDAAMMDSYGVSRTVLREALRTLEAKGLVEARPKVGTRVTPQTHWNFFDQQVLAWHFEAEPAAGFHKGLFDIRLALESRAAELACQKRTAEHVRLMKYWVHQMETAGDSVESHALANLEIHRIIAEASGNQLLRSALGLVELTVALAAAIDDDDTRAAVTAVHAELVDAIEAGDAARSADSMRQVVGTELTLVEGRGLAAAATSK